MPNNKDLDTVEGKRDKPFRLQARYGYTKEQTKKLTNSAIDSISHCFGCRWSDLWVINSYIPMQSTIKKILNVVVVIVVIIWLLNVFGLIGDLSTIRIGK